MHRMETTNRTNRADRICTLLYTGSHTTEAQGEYSLPDYLPDVRRVLRVTASPRVTGRYMNGERLELEGNAAVVLLYMAEDGTIHSFQNTLPFSQNIAVAGLDETAVVSVRIHPENASCRLSGPRKCTLRTRLRTSVRATAERDVTPDTASLPGDETLCTRNSAYPACTLICVSAGDLRYSEDIPVGNAPISEVLSCTVMPVVSDARATGGNVVCKGEYLIDALCTVADDNGPAYRCLSRRVPFSETVSAQDIPDGCRCEPDLSVVSVTPTITEEGRGLGVDFAAECAVVCSVDSAVSVMSDAFLPSSDVRITSEAVQSYLPVRVTNGNFSAAGSIRQDNGETVRAIIDCHMTPTLDHTACEGGRLILSGTMEINAIAQAEDGTFFPVNGSIPLRWETDAAGLDAQSMFVTNECRVLSSAARPDADGTVSCEAELAVLLSAAGLAEVSRPLSVTVPKDAPKAEKPTCPVLLCYPERGETIWDIARRCRMTPAVICRANDLPEDTETIPDSITVLFVPVAQMFSAGE